jgi:hypothetical protein
MFFAIAAVQLNDADPIYWAAVYLIAAIVPAARVAGYQLPTTCKIAFGMVVAGLLISSPGFLDYLTSGDYAAIGGQMMVEKPYVESAREFLGLLIAAACVAFYARVDVGAQR